MAFAPSEAINSIMDQQKSAYDDFVKKLKTSSQQELEQIIRAILYSEDLDNEMKVALSQIVCNSLDKLKENSQIR